MSDKEDNFGGRVPLLHPAELTAEQRPVYDRVNSTMVPWAQSSGFIAVLADGRLVGPFNTILFSPQIANVFLDLQAAEQKHTTLSDRVRQVVILTVGAVWKSDYERYAHSAVAHKMGLSARATEKLCRGEGNDDLTDEEALAQRITFELTATHELSDQLYTEANATFGKQGIVDLIFLAGCYDLVSSLLNAFRVPVPV